MYRDVSRKALEKFEELNYKPSPDFGADIETEELIEAITQQCKSTVVKMDDNNEYNMKKYESNINKDVVGEIVRQLILNGNHISKEVMNKFLCKDNDFHGINSDVELYKGIDSETGEKNCNFERSYISNEELMNIDGFQEDINKLYKDYARDMILKDSKAKNSFFPKQNTFKLFKEKITHKSFSNDRFREEYSKLLKKYSGVTNENIIKNSVDYKVKYLTSNDFKKNIMNSIKNGTAIEILNKNNDKYENLLNQITAEIEEQSYSIPDLNEAFKDIDQIYFDTKAQLEAYSTDIRGLSPEKIEDKIKEINLISLSSEKSKYLGENGYRNKNATFNNGGDGVKLLPKEYLEDAMKNLSNEINILVNSSQNLKDDEYLKKASDLTYRFIRIHPFPDSNGRTSKALMNMMSLNRNILVKFPKEDKCLYLSAMKNTNCKVDEKDYLNYLHTDPKKANDIEKDCTSDIYEYIKANSNNGIKKYENTEEISIQENKVNDKIEIMDRN